MLMHFNEAKENFASVLEDNRLKIWDVSTGSLRQEFVEKDHLSYKYTSMAWSQKMSNHKKSKRNASRGLGLIALGTDTGVIVVWDLQRGEILFHLGKEKAGEDQNLSINDLVFNDQGTILYSCSNGKYIYEWDLKDGQKLRRFKCGSEGAKKLAISSKTSVLAAASSSIKIFDLSSGKKSRTLAGGHSSPMSILSFCPKGRFLFSGSTGDRFINAYDTSLETSDPTKVFSLDSSPIGISILLDEEVNPMICTLAATSENGQCSIWRTTIEMNGKPLLASTKIGLAKNKNHSTSSPRIFCTTLQGKSDQITLCRGSQLKPHFEKVSYVDGKHALLKEIHVEPITENLLIESKKAKLNSEEQKLPVYTTDKGMKQKTTIVDGEVSPAIEEQNKVENEEELMTLAERIEVLRQSMESEMKSVENKDHPVTKKMGPKPSASSLVTVLEQALQSKDDDLLEYCISTSDSKVVETTVERLPSTRVLDFLTRIVGKFEKEPSRGSLLCLWIKALLMKHTAYLITIPDLVLNLSNLYQTLEMRLGVFQDLWKLSGRLDLALAQISERSAVSLVPTEEKAPAYVYNEDDDNDYLERVDEEEEEEEEPEAEVTGDEEDIGDEMDEDDFDEMSD